MQAGDRVFVVAEVTGHGSAVERRVVEGRIVEVRGETVNVAVSAAGETTCADLPRSEVFKTTDDADQRLVAVLATEGRRAVRAAAGGRVDFLPQSLRIPVAPLVSGNFLRGGEHGVVLSFQTNSVGSERNPQKLLQIAGAVMEEIKVLWAMLDVLGYANDFAKKVIGKHVIIEMESLLGTFNALAEQDPRCKPSLQTLSNEIGRQKQRRGEFRSIRNKLGGHRDPALTLREMMEMWKRITRLNLSRCLDAFVVHINDLREFYPYEVGTHFPSKRLLLHGVMMPTAQSTEYVPFDSDSPIDAG